MPNVRNDSIWKHKKTCTVCMYPIVRVRDTYFKRGKNGVKYALNIHWGACTDWVYQNNIDAFKQSAKKVNDITQLALFK